MMYIALSVAFTAIITGIVVWRWLSIVEQQIKAEVQINTQRLVSQARLDEMAATIESQIAELGGIATEHNQMKMHLQTLNRQRI